MERWLSWSKAHDWKSCEPLKGSEGSNPSLSATSERVTLVPIFLFRKKSVTRSTVPPFPQKVTLRLCCSLVNALTTLRLATNFLRVGAMVTCWYLFCSVNPLD